MATRSRGKPAQGDQNKIAAVKKHFDNRVFLLDGMYSKIKFLY